MTSTYRPTDPNYQDDRMRELGYQPTDWSAYRNSPTVLEASAVNNTETLLDHLIKNNPHGRLGKQVLSERLAAELRLKRLGLPKMKPVVAQGAGKHDPLAGDDGKVHHAGDVPAATENLTDRLVQQSTRGMKTRKWSASTSATPAPSTTRHPTTGRYVPAGTAATALTRQADRDEKVSALVELFDHQHGRHGE